MLCFDAIVSFLFVNTGCFSTSNLLPLLASFQMLHFGGMHVGCATCVTNMLAALLFLLCVKVAMLPVVQDLLVQMTLCQQQYKQLAYCKCVFPPLRI